MDSKVLISLVSVALGWMLAQGTALAKEWWAARKLRSGLVTELEDIQDQLQRVILIHSRHLQIFALKGMEPASALPIQNMFFKQYFKEAFSRLNREQRISYQLIHASLENLNKKNEDLAKFAEDAYKDLRLSPDEKKKLAIINVWGDRVIALYKTAMQVRWHIAYHLRNPATPGFDIMGPMHESYVKFEEELDAEVKTILEKAKGLKMEDFEKVYDSNAFARNKDVG
ncbi:MAG: hypothetical protein ACREXV_05130 [Polaromonas sp.]